MFKFVLEKIFGSAHQKTLKKMHNVVRGINSLEPSLVNLSDSDLRAKTDEFRERHKKETLDAILPEAFALVREAANRVLNMRHFDVQLIGGIALHKGMIAEMRTGEGKTLVATLPAYLNALTGKGVHIVTVNDYLAQRDASWMGKIYEFLGLTVGCVIGGLNDAQRREAYSSDITYGTNNEFGFDYLRDNLKYDVSQLVQGPHHFAMIDEVDSILIDEARTPLNISGSAEIRAEMYVRIDALIKQIPEDAYEVDGKMRSVVLSEKGNVDVERLLKQHGIIPSNSNMYDVENMTIVHHVNQALKAYKIFKNDVDYIVKDDKVFIVDEFTGRIMDGRRYSEGLHQAIEAKERVKIQDENQTIASITFQNYFRLYSKLAGMTGTASTEAVEFKETYALDVLPIPTHKNVIRRDKDDIIYKTAKEKYDAIIAEIKEAHEKNQPVLVGTISIEKSEHISSLLKKHEIPHSVLNAKYHAQEAEIIAQAGRSGAVTIATNMAGRGTDIMLGGNPEMMYSEMAPNLQTQTHVSEYSEHEHTKQKDRIIGEVAQDKAVVVGAGGLLIVGTERHESRRIDDQLRGRSGRQGDPGRTVFFLSLEDDLMRLFGSEKLAKFLTKLGLKEGEAITHPWVTKSLQKAQQRVEAHHYEMRKNLLQFDDVMTEQRKVVYAQRAHILEQPADLSAALEGMVLGVNERLINTFMKKGSHPEEWDLANLEKEVFRFYGVEISLTSYENGAEDIANKIEILSKDAIFSQRNKFGDESFGRLLQQIFIVTLDYLWRDHLSNLDMLRTGINLRAYAQKNPLTEYKFEAFKMFEILLTEFEESVVQRVFHVSACSEEDDVVDGANDSQGVHKTPNTLGNDFNPNQKSVPMDKGRNYPRNQLCYCGSRKKYKHCHGVIV